MYIQFYHFVRLYIFITLHGITYNVSIKVINITGYSARPAYMASDFYIFVAISNFPLFTLFISKKCLNSF